MKYRVTTASYESSQHEDPWHALLEYTLDCVINGWDAAPVVRLEFSEKGMALDGSADILERVDMPFPNLLFLGTQRAHAFMRELEGKVEDALRKSYAIDDAVAARPAVQALDLGRLRPRGVW